MVKKNVHYIFIFSHGGGSALSGHYKIEKLKQAIYKYAILTSHVIYHDNISNSSISTPNKKENAYRYDLPFIEGGVLHDTALYWKERRRRRKNILTIQ